MHLTVRLRVISMLSFLVVALANFDIVSSSGKGTTANIKTIFLGRCYEYLQLNELGNVLRNKNCSSLYDTFEAAFINKTTCNTTYSGVFDTFFQQIDPGVTPMNKVKDILYFHSVNA